MSGQHRLTFLERLTARFRSKAVEKSAAVAREWIDSDKPTITVRELTAGSGNMEDGRHYTDAIEEVKAAMRERRDADAERLILRALGAAENEAHVMRWGAPPWYYERLAVLYRRQKRFDEEIALLERFGQQEHGPGATPAKLADRLVKAKALRARRKPQPVASNGERGPHIS